MSKKSRFNEYREAMFSEKPATATERREYLKRWGANKIAAQRDRLTERATYCAKHFALGGLRSVCWAAGKANDWIDPHIFGLCEMCIRDRYRKNLGRFVIVLTRCTGC